LGLSNIPAFQHVDTQKILFDRFAKPVFINSGGVFLALGVA